MNEITEEIISSTDIAELIGETVKLRPSSRGYVGLCPFHQEDTASFHVYTDTNSYYCFGCQRGGNVFTYVMEKEHVNFTEALQILSDRAGIRLPDKRGKKTVNIHDIMKLSEEFFIENLKASNAGLAYLKKRSLTEGDIQRFRLGYAPESWDALTLYLRKHGLNDRAIIDSGLAVQSRTGIYDRFRGRIIFPVHDITGRTIAFGGRIITGEGAKYINSPESEIYRKRRNLYLMDIARKSILEKKRSILCEGYMDALRLQKSGFHESVASLGTSLTSEQAEMLSRYADRCYICYDSDSAGQKAAIKGMYILQSHGLDVHVIRLPEGKDPDEFLLSHSPDEFEELIRAANPLVIAHIESLRSRLEDASTRKGAIRELFSSFETLRASEVLEYKAQLCDATHLLPDEVESMLTNHEEPERIMPVFTQESNDRLECALCYMLMNSERFILYVNPAELDRIIRSESVQSVLHSIMNEDVNMLRNLWIQTGNTETLGMLENGRLLCEEMKGITDEEKFKRIYSGLMRGYIDRRIAEINGKPEKERNYRELFSLYQKREKYQK